MTIEGHQSLKEQYKANVLSEGKQTFSKDRNENLKTNSGAIDLTGRLENSSSNQTDVLEQFKKYQQSQEINNNKNIASRELPDNQKVRETNKSKHDKSVNDASKSPKIPTSDVGIKSDILERFNREYGGSSNPIKPEISASKKTESPLERYQNEYGNSRNDKNNDNIPIPFKDNEQVRSPKTLSKTQSREVENTDKKSERLTKEFGISDYTRTMPSNSKTNILQNNKSEQFKIPEKKAESVLDWFNRDYGSGASNKDHRNSETNYPDPGNNVSIPSKQHELVKSPKSSSRAHVKDDSSGKPGENTESVLDRFRREHASESYQQSKNPDFQLKSKIENDFNRNDYQSSSNDIKPESVLDHFNREYGSSLSRTDQHKRSSEDVSKKPDNVLDRFKEDKKTRGKSTKKEQGKQLKHDNIRESSSERPNNQQKSGLPNAKSNRINNDDKYSFQKFNPDSENLNRQADKRSPMTLADKMESNTNNFVSKKQNENAIRSEIECETQRHTRHEQLSENAKEYDRLKNSEEKRSQEKTGESRQSRPNNQQRRKKPDDTLPRKTMPKDEEKTMPKDKEKTMLKDKKNMAKKEEVDDIFESESKKKREEMERMQNLIMKKTVRKGTPVKATLPLKSAVKSAIKTDGKGVKSATKTDGKDVKTRPVSASSTPKRSASFTNISNIKPSARATTPDTLNSSSIRDQVYLDWLQRKNSFIKEKKLKEDEVQKKQEQEEAGVKEERIILARKTFEAWTGTKKERDKKTLGVKKKEKISKKEEEEEKAQKLKDANKTFENWKQTKDERLKEERRKKKREEKEKRNKEHEESVEKSADAKKVFENWKMSRDEDLKKKIKEKKRLQKNETEAELDKIEKQREAQRAYESWKEKSSSRPSTPKLSQRAWCPNGFNAKEVLKPGSMKPVVQRNAPPSRRRTLSASTRLYKTS